MQVLVRLMTRMSGAFLYVRLETDGDWGPQNVFCTVNFDNIVRVENEIVEM